MVRLRWSLTQGADSIDGLAKLRTRARVSPDDVEVFESMVEAVCGET